MATFTGHQDAVRGLALVPDIGFASCSNDAEIRVWTFGGDLVYTLSGHTSFVYSLSVLPNGDIVSGGEDRSVRVWTDGECSQIITHPAISVWTVSTMPNGDIVSGCSDHKVRIFSASEERWASEAALTEYNDQVASQALPAEQVGDVKKSDLPGPDALKDPGKKAGEVKMIRNGANVEAHQWDATNFKWEKIGDVVDAVGQGRRQLYNGKEYDYVFDVDIQDGVPPLKLPYNVTENPYSAAQRFLESNDLPLTYLDEVVHFIEKNTAGVKLGTGGDEFVDPFTGASRYRSTGDSGQSQGSQPRTQYMDPFTGASRYSGASQAPPTTPPASIVLPASKWIPFKQIKDVAAIQRKIFELNGTLRHEISTSALVLYPDEISALDEAFAYLSHVTATPPEQPPNTLAPSHVEEILQIVDRWPPSQRYPLIDLSRLIIGYCPDLMRTPGLCGTFFRSLFKASEWESWDSQLSKTQQTNILLLLKALANVFQDGYAPEMSWIGEVLTYLAQAMYQSLGKTQRAAYATVLFNLSCVSLKTPLEPGLQNGHLDLLLRVVKNEENDAESAYRALVGLGNVIHATRSAIPSLSNGQVSEVKESVSQSASKFSGEARIQNVVRKILTLL